MATLKNRGFTYKNLAFWLNDNYTTREFTGKYTLLFWHKGYKRWQEIAKVNSKKEAKAYVVANYNYI